MTVISVIEFMGKKVFECDGIRFQKKLLSARQFGDRESPVDILKNGEVVESGALAYVKDPPDTPTRHLMFVGLKSKPRWQKYSGGLPRFELDDFAVGEAIVIHAFPERKFVVETLARGLLCGSGSYYTRLSLDEYPYPHDWRQRPDEVRRIWKQKLARYEADLRAAGISYIHNGDRQTPPVKKDCSFDITICEVDGQKYFSCDGVCFNLLPTLNVFYYNRHSLEVYSPESVTPVTVISIYTVCKCDTTIFQSREEIGQQLLGGRDFVHWLTPEHFDLNQRLRLNSNIEYDLIRELALHWGSWGHIPELSMWRDVWPDFGTDDRIYEEGVDLRDDLRNYFSRAVDRELTKLLKGKQIKVLTVLSGY